MRVNVENTGLKRTGRAIPFFFNMIGHFRANELRWVKSFVMLWISWDFRETFIPAYCGLTPTRPVYMSQRVRRNLTHLFRSRPDQTTGKRPTLGHADGCAPYW